MIRDTHDDRGALRLPPHNIEAEMAVLGAIIRDADALFEVVPVLDFGDFYRESHETVYRAIRGMADAGLRVDTVTLADRLDAAGALAGIGGIEFIAELTNSVPHSADALFHAAIVRQKADTRRVIGRANDAIRRAYSNQFTAEQLVAGAQADFLSIGDRSAGSDVTLREAAGMAVDTMDRRGRGEDPGVRLPYRELDHVLDGLRPGRLYVIAGRPGSGKSCLLFNAACDAASVSAVPALMFSLEMGAEELGERYLSATARVNGYGFKAPGDLSADAMGRINRAAADASERLRIDDDAGLTVAQIAARSRRSKHRHGLGLILVDYLQLVDGCKGKGENRQEEIAKVSRGLKRLAKELRVPVVAACQLNRGVENRPASEQRPRMSDLRESGQIEQDAHAVLLLHAPDDAPGSVEVIVAKNRGGSTGKFSLRFVREETRFEEVIPDAAEIPEAAY